MKIIRAYRYYLICIFVLLTAVGFTMRPQRAPIEMPLQPIIVQAASTETPTPLPASPTALPETPTATATDQPIVYDVVQPANPPVVAPQNDGCDPSPCGTVIWVTPVVLQDARLQRPTVVTGQHIYGDWRDTDPMYQHK